MHAQHSSNRIKVWRAEYDLTQQQLADEIGVTRRFGVTIEEVFHYDQ